MFSATDGGDCKNRYIDLSVDYTTQKTQIAHRLFLLTKGDQDSYSLECNIKVCAPDSDLSDCDTMISECLVDNCNTVNADNECTGCEDGFWFSDDKCLSNDLKECVCNNGEGATGNDCPNNGDSHCAEGSCVDGYNYQNAAC